MISYCCLAAWTERSAMRRSCSPACSRRAMRSEAEYFILSVASARRRATSLSASALAIMLLRSCSCRAASSLARRRRSLVASLVPKMAEVSLPNPSTTLARTPPRPWRTLVTVSPMAAKGDKACVMALVFSSEDLRPSITFCRTLASSPRMAIAGVALKVFRPVVTPLIGAMTD